MPYTSDLANPEAIGLLERLRSGNCDDAELSAIVVRLNLLLPDPHWFSYAIDHVPELSAEAVIARARAYRPISL